jgi:hypothetical protein
MQFASKQHTRIWRSGSVDKKETLNVSADSAILLVPKPISSNVAREKERKQTSKDDETGDDEKGK